MGTYQVTCINKRIHQSPYERIKAIGGQGWTLAIDDAIYRIDSGQDQFWVAPPGQNSVWIRTAVGPSGRKYLKTEADGAEPNNLLSLPECP